MPNAKELAEAKRRLQESEEALLHLGVPDPADPALRARVARELREALEHYYSVVSGQKQKGASNGQ